MSKSFQRGLVVGKFAPLHRGHEFIINRAFAACREVIIISYCKPEVAGCETERRRHWLAKLFPQARILVLDDESLVGLRVNGREVPELPTDAATGEIHSRFCGFLCASILGVTVDAVFTSEDYGDSFAEQLTHYFQARNPETSAVQHILVDRNRVNVPISGTLLRANVHSNRQWLAPAVYRSFVQRVCLLGGESSGKSTLAESLAREFETVQVAEYGRALWEAKNGLLGFADMIRIARRQVALEDEAAEHANHYLFCDTSPLTTLFYSRHMFGRAEAELERLADRFYDHVVLCAPDFPFMQDGTRQPESFRQQQHEWYLRELAARKIQFLLATGSVPDRVGRVKRALTALHKKQPALANSDAID